MYMQNINNTYNVKEYMYILSQPTLLYYIYKLFSNSYAKKVHYLLK